MKIQIVFFDGYCNLCNSSVDYIIRKNRAKNLYYSSLQGELSAKLGLNRSIDSVIFWDKGIVYKNSSAAFELLPHVQSTASKFLLPFKYIPRFITDIVYKMIARSRYRIFGKRTTCRVASMDEIERFLS